MADFIAPGYNPLELKLPCFSNEELMEEHSLLTWKTVRELVLR